MSNQLTNKWPTENQMTSWLKWPAKGSADSVTWCFTWLDDSPQSCWNSILLKPSRSIRTFNCRICICILFYTNYYCPKVSFHVQIMCNLFLFVNIAINSIYFTLCIVYLKRDLFISLIHLMLLLKYCLTEWFIVAYVHCTG